MTEQSDLPAMGRLSMLAWTGVTLLMTILLMLGLVSAIDQEPPPAADFTRADQCETLNVTGKIAEPQNTWSNIAFVAAGLLIFYRSRRLRSITVGVFLCAAGVFSAMYHAVPTNETLQMFHVASISWVLLAMIGYAILTLDFYGYNTQRDPVFEKMIGVVSLILGLVMAITRTHVAIFESTVTALSLVTVLVVLFLLGYFLSGYDGKKELTTYEKVSYLTVVIILALLAALFGIFDGTGKGGPKALCSPDGLFQAHAAWHVLTAALLLICFDYFARLSNQWDERIFSDPDSDA